MQLEDLCGQLFRGLPSAERSSVAESGAQLQLVHGRNLSATRAAVESYPRRSDRGQHSATLPAGERGSDRRLFLDLSELDAELLSGQCFAEYHSAAWTRTDAGDF